MSSCRPHLSIDDWLEKLDLSVYRCLLKDYVAVEDILWMSERDLKAIGIKNGSHRARISSSLTILKEKYTKFSKEDQSFRSDNGRLRPETGNKSFSSLSPVNKIGLDKPHSGVHSWPSSVTSSSYNTKHSSPRSSMEGCGLEATADELKQALEKELSLDCSDLRSYAWYHGTILRQRAEDLVINDGNFLVRDCISQPGDFVITCRWKSLPLHFIIKKIILNPDTLYERVQFSFEKDSFDSIPDFITYYVGSRCALSESSGAIISHPVNRTMPLTYYASRYGIQCQIHYAAKKLEKLPVDCSPTVTHQCDEGLPTDLVEKSVAFKAEQLGNSELSKNNHMSHLTRVGSDPMLSPNTERKRLDHRPNSGNFSSEIKLVSLKVEDRPPPKPSRVPSKKYTQRPLVLKKFPSSPVKDDSEAVPENSIKIQGVSQAHCSAVKRQISETRFSFLDRPSISDDGSESSIDTVLFTVPLLSPPSIFDPQHFSSELLNYQNSPLEGSVLSSIKEALLSNSSKMLAYHLTWMDLEVAKNSKSVDLGLGITNGLELFLLPQGQQLQKDLLERTECLKLFVAITILTTPERDEQIQLLDKWINIAIETKTTVGNLFGFTSIMLGLTLPEILGLHSTWLALRHSYTESAYSFETKLRPTFKALQLATGLEAPNTCLPYILSLIVILQQYKKVMDVIDNNPLETELISEAILDFDVGVTSSSDFGLQLLEDHLEVGRYIMQQCPVFKQNGKITLQNVKYKDKLLDIFSTEFHLRMLWGFRGSVVSSEERYLKFQKVLTLLYNKCNEIHA